MCLGFVPTLRVLADRWNSDPYAGHGVFAPLYSAFLVWRERERLRRLPLGREPLGLMLVLTGGAGLLWGSLGDSLALRWLSIVTASGGLVLWLAGWKWLRALAFPLGFLTLALPLPRAVVDSVSTDVQLLVAGLASLLIDACGTPVYHDGVHIALPNVTLEVAEVCNGLRFLMVLLTVSIALAHASNQRLARKVLLVGAALPLAVGANAVRVAALGLAVSYGGAAWSSGVRHHLIGKAVWLAALGALFCLWHPMREKRSRSHGGGLEGEAPRQKSLDAYERESLRQVEG